MAKAKLILARILVDALIGGVVAVKVNDVVTGKADDIDVLVKAGQADKNTKAVAYAQSLNPGVDPILIGDDAEDDKSADIQTAKDKVAALEAKLNTAADADKAAIQTELDAANAELKKLES